MVDWDLAGRTARRLIERRPADHPEEAAAVVRDLHEAAADRRRPRRGAHRA